MNIRGLSEATLEQLIQLGALKGYQDLYHLDRYREEIITLEGFGEKSYENMVASINASRNTTFVRFVVVMDIPLIGRTASRILDGHFHGSLRELEMAALDRFDFTCLEGIGDIMSGNIHAWFRNSDHLLLWRNLQKELKFENGMDAKTSGKFGDDCLLSMTVPRRSLPDSQKCRQCCLYVDTEDDEDRTDEKLYQNRDASI